MSELWQVVSARGQTWHSRTWVWKSEHGTLHSFVPVLYLSVLYCTATELNTETSTVKSQDMYSATYCVVLPEI